MFVRLRKQKMVNATMIGRHTRNKEEENGSCDYDGSAHAKRNGIKVTAMTMNGLSVDTEARDKQSKEYGICHDINCPNRLSKPHCDFLRTIKTFEKMTY